MSDIWLRILFCVAVGTGIYWLYCYVQLLSARRKAIEDLEEMLFEIESRERQLCKLRQVDFLVDPDEAEKIVQLVTTYVASLEHLVPRYQEVCELSNSELALLRAKVKVHETIQRM